MRRLARNRYVPMVLTAGNMVFWLCLRDISGVVEAYPFLGLVYRAGIQLAAFFVLGVTLSWALYAWKPDGGWGRLCAKAVGTGIAFVLFQRIYNLLVRRRVYGVNPWVELAGVCAGALLCGLLLGRWSGEPEVEPRVSWEPVSRYRGQLMGVAMLWIILLHSMKTDVLYVLPLNVVARLGNSGADMFLFVSGVGMVYSLSQSPNVLGFYRRRARRIYPEAAPWIAIYGVICVCAAYYSVSMLIADCVGIGFWVSARGFNWYYSFILLLYLVAPLMYSLLRERRGRYAWAIAMIAASLVFLIFIYDVLGVRRMLIAFSRFPVFVIGMLAGFWMKEGNTLSRGEYLSAIPIAALAFLLAYFLDLLELHSMVGSMWLCYCAAAPVFCLLLARLFSRLNDGGVMRFLSWAGRNSLSLYIWNIILTRLYAMYIPIAPESNMRRLLASIGIAAANILIVALIKGIKWKLIRIRRPQ